MKGFNNLAQIMLHTVKILKRKKLHEKKKQDFYIRIIELSGCQKFSKVLDDKPKVKVLKANQNPGYH